MDTIKYICPNCKKLNRLPYKNIYKKANCGNCKNSLLIGGIIEANDNNFYDIIQNVTVPVVVDFWAPWCGPCQMMAPNFKAASQQLALKAQFVKVNTQEAPNLAAQFGIQSIPTIIIFKNGVEVQRISGALTTEQIVTLLSQYI